MAVAVGTEILKLKNLTQATSIVVTHDRNLAFGIADRMAMIKDGQILFIGSPEELKNNPDPVIQEFLVRRTPAPWKPNPEYAYERLHRNPAWHVLRLGDHCRPCHIGIPRNFCLLRQRLPPARAVQKRAGVESRRRRQNGRSRFGRVEDIKLTSNAVAEVTVNLDRKADVKIDSKATLKFTGFLGQNYMDIAFGAGTVQAADGATLQTVEQPDLSDLMGKLDSVATGVENLTKSFSGEQIDKLLGPLTEFVKNNQTNLTATISNIRTFRLRPHRAGAGHGGPDW